jgi:hypothetical protein
LKLRYFEPHKAGIHVLAGVFVLVLDSARSIASKSKKKSQKAQLQNWRVGLVLGGGVW